MTTATKNANANPNQNQNQNAHATASPADHVAAAAETCCRTANDAMKSMQSGFEVWSDAGKKMFDAYASAFGKGVAMPFGWTMPTMPTGDQQSMPFAVPASVPAAFAQMTKAMHGLVDANARFATECTALAIDAARANARIVERSGELMLNQWAAAASTSPSAKQPQMPTDAVRSIVDEASTFARVAGDRFMSIQGEHAKSVAGIVDRTVNGMKPGCCSTNGAARTA